VCSSDLAGTTAITVTVVDDSHNHIISNVDNLQDSLNSRMVTDFSNVSGTLPVANGGTGATSFTAGQMLKGNGTSAIQAASNLREVVDTVFVDKFLNVDAATLYVDAVDNRVGIGTSTPVSKFDINGAFRITKSSFIAPSSGSGMEWTFRTDNAGYLTCYDRDSTKYRDLTLGVANFNLDTDFDGVGNFVVKEITGNVGIGTTTPSEKLDVVGNIYASGDISGADIIDRSDIRLKENIYQYENGLNDILQLNPIYYNLKDTPDRQKIGFIAQDVRNVLPQAVTGNEQNGFLGISYSAFSAVLTKAIQEQQTIIESQETEISTLKTQIQLILNEIQIIKNN
jgi:hypothetical protein